MGAIPCLPENIDNFYQLDYTKAFDRIWTIFFYKNENVLTIYLIESKTSFF